MSTITVCDRCARHCTPGMRRSVVHLTELQFAISAPQNPVAEDSYQPADLCDICTDVIKAAIGEALRIAQHYHPGEDGPMLVRPFSEARDPVGLLARAEAPTLEARERDIPERADARPEP